MMSLVKVKMWCEDAWFFLKALNDRVEMTLDTFCDSYPYKLLRIIKNIISFSYKNIIHYSCPPDKTLLCKFILCHLRGSLRVTTCNLYIQLNVMLCVCLHANSRVLIHFPSSSATHLHLLCVMVFWGHTRQTHCDLIFLSNKL